MTIGAKTGGRKKGTPNKFTGELREMILNALDSAGGEKYLVKQSAENPTAFMTLIGKVLPMRVEPGAGSGFSLTIHGQPRE